MTKKGIEEETEALSKRPNLCYWESLMHLVREASNLLPKRFLFLTGPLPDCL
jgi:hypothetical protein